MALAPDDFKPADALGPSDFLVRGLAGFDPQAGVLLVGGGARLVRPASAAPTSLPYTLSCNPNLTPPLRAVAWGQLVRYSQTGRVLWEALLVPQHPRRRACPAQLKGMIWCPEDTQRDQRGRWAQGQRLRFMVRDREGAMQDMREHAVELKRRSLQARCRTSWSGRAVACTCT